MFFVIDTKYNRFSRNEKLTQESAFKKIWETFTRSNKFKQRYMIILL